MAPRSHPSLHLFCGLSAILGLTTLQPVMAQTGKPMEPAKPVDARSLVPLRVQAIAQSAGMCFVRASLDRFRLADCLYGNALVRDVTISRVHQVERDPDTKEYVLDATITWKFWMIGDRFDIRATICVNPSGDWLLISTGFNDKARAIFETAPMLVNAVQCLAEGDEPDTAWVSKKSVTNPMTGKVRICPSANRRPKD